MLKLCTAYLLTRSTVSYRSGKKLYIFLIKPWLGATSPVFYLVAELAPLSWGWLCLQRFSTAHNGLPIRHPLRRHPYGDQSQETGTISSATGYAVLIRPVLPQRVHYLVSYLPRSDTILRYSLETSQLIQICPWTDTWCVETRRLSQYDDSPLLRTNNPNYLRGTNTGYH